MSYLSWIVFISLGLGLKRNNCRVVMGIRHIDASVGTNVTLFHRPEGFVPGIVDSEEIMSCPISNFSKEIIYKDASCSDIKNNGAKAIKVSVNISGSVVQKYQADAKESEYGRVEYTCPPDLQGCIWNLYKINRHDFENVHILCAKGNGREGYVTYQVVDYAILKEININTSGPSTKGAVTTKPTSSKAPKMPDGCCFAVVMLLVLLVL